MIFDKVTIADLEAAESTMRAQLKAYDAKRPLTEADNWSYGVTKRALIAVLLDQSLARRPR